MKIKDAILFILLFLCLASSSVSAGIIRIVLNPIDVSVNETGVVPINVQLVNLGDESAENVRLTLILPKGFTTNPSFIGTLPTNTQLNISFKVTLPDDLASGVYPAVVMTDYTDLNNYPFSSVTPGVITLKEQVYPLLFADMNQVTVKDTEKATITVTVRNMDENSHNLSIRFYVPREIKTNQTKVSFSLEAKTERKIQFEVSPFGALPMSNYLTFVSVEYEDLRHYTIYPTKPGVISIGGEPMQPPSQKSVSNTDKSELGESSLVKKLPYILIVFSAVVIYASFKLGD